MRTAVNITAENCGIVPQVTQEVPYPSVSLLKLFISNHAMCEVLDGLLRLILRYDYGSFTDNDPSTRATGNNNNSSHK